MKSYEITIATEWEQFKTEMRLSEVEYHAIKTLLDQLLMVTNIYSNIEELEE